MSRFSMSSMAAASLLLASVSPALFAQAPGGRIEVRALIGAGIPAGPVEFSGIWNTGFGSGLTVGYLVAPKTEIGATTEYQQFGYSPDVVYPASSGVPLGDPGFRSSEAGNTLWAGWLDATRLFMLDPKLQARIHGGVGVVSLGTARTGVGLRVGTGLDVPVSTHFSMIFDATFAHAFTQDDTGRYPLGTPFSYLPLRAGVSWR